MEQLQINKEQLIATMEGIENYESFILLAELDQKQRFELKADTERVIVNALKGQKLVYLGETVKGLLYKDVATNGLIEISAVIKKATKDSTLAEVAEDLLIEKLEKSIAKVDREIDKAKRAESKKK